MTGFLQSLIEGGSLLLAIPIATLAGLISFASPCVLPLVPGYLGYVGGFTGGAEETRKRGRLVLGVALFVLGFSAVFVTLSLAFSIAGLLLIPWLDTITRIIGLVIIVMGLVFMGSFGFMQRSVKPGWKVATGLGGAPLLGIAFGLGWAPCMGPTLSLVIALSLNEQSASRGIVLGLAYCLGLGIPFLLLALGVTWATGTVSWFKTHIRAINLVGGALLVTVGILMATGMWQVMMSQFTSVIGGFVTPI